MAEKNPSFKLPTAMTVAGSDSGAGAGIQADMLTFAAHGVYGTTAISAITAQNPDEVSSISVCTPNTFSEQLERCIEFFRPNSAKTGMLFEAELVEIAADFFSQHKEISLVVDPVMISTSKAKLLKDDAVEVLKTKLIPQATIFTPNLDEAAALLGVEKIDSENQIDSALKLVEKYESCVLLKGGHLSTNEIADIFADKNGNVFPIKSKRIDNIDTHGSGCTLSAAISANLAKGKDLLESCKLAQAYILDCMENPLYVGGRYFINHFPKKF